MSPGASTAFPPFWTQADVLTGITVDMDNQEFGSPVPNAGALHEDNNISLEMNFQLGDLTLGSITAYQDEEQHVIQDLFAINQYIYPAFTGFLVNVAGVPDFVVYDPNVFPQFENYQDINEDVSQFSQELKLVSPADQRISFVAGLFFSGTTVELDQLRNFFDKNPGGAYVDIDVKSVTDTYDAYGRVTSKLTDTTSLVTGLRVNYDHIEYTYNQVNQSGYGPYYSEGDDDSTAIVGDISLQKDLGDTMIYGTYARGYKPKAYNTATTLHANVELEPVDQEKINHFEIGSKGVYFGHTLALNTAAFYTKYTDYQIQTFITQPGSQFPELNLQSAGEASTKGIELDTTWAPTSTFTAGFRAAYIDAKFDKFTDAACYGNTENTLPPNATLNDDGDYVQDVSGEPMPNSPKFKFVVNAEKRFPLPNTVFDLALGGTYSYRTEAHMTPNQNPHAIQDAFGILNLHVTLDRMNGKYALTAFCNNVFDQNYYVDLEDFWTGPWNGNVVIGQPARDASRYFGVRFDVNF
jgi:iron complex outermembrane receptor protein